MTQELQVIAALSRFLFQQIDVCRSRNDLAEWGDVLDMVKPLLDEKLDGLGTELWLWLGLKVDNPPMADDYRTGILQGYSRVLSPPRS